MKPLYLELQAFGPFADKQTVNFEKLSESGLFLITGETGSGKTTIFDAMTFALYGGASGDDSKSRTGRNDLAEWRCTQADRKTETYVSLLFSVRGRKYRFKRRLNSNVKNKTEIYEAGEMDEEGVLHPFFENPKAKDLAEKAESLIGLNKEQFRQVVLLPQGQFERFLTASSAEKEEILKKIFGADLWSKRAEAFYNSAKRRKDALDELKTDIDRSLQEEGLTALEELAGKIGSLQEEKQHILAVHEAFDGDAKQKALDADRELAQRFRPLHELEKRSRELLERRAEIKEKQEKYTAAEKAERLRAPIEAYEAARKERAKRLVVRDELEKKLPGAEKKNRDATEKRDRFKADSHAEEWAKQIAVYADKREAYANMAALGKNAAAAETEYRKAESVYSSAAKALEVCIRKASELKQAFDAADKKAKEYRDRYYEGIYGEIAAELKDGEKCPVCGSTTHPAPAEKCPDSVSKADVDRAERIAGTEKQAWAEAEEERAKADGYKTEKQKELSGAESRLMDARAKRDAAAAGLIAGIADQTALERAIAGLEKQIRDEQAYAERLEADCLAAAKALTALGTDIENAQREEVHAAEELTFAVDEMEEALAQNGFEKPEPVKALLLPQEQRTALQKEIIEYESSCKTTDSELEELRKELAGSTEPDASRFAARAKEIKDESIAFSGSMTKNEMDTRRLTAKLERLEKKQQEYQRDLPEAENDLGFAKKLRGDAGVGLQRYVLAIMFNQVIEEANRMLTKVHGGRYCLFRSSDKGQGNKRGLELKAHDSRSPENEGRSVGMLSGGEKFLVSLALSIGMSAVARRSGVQIEALFIDEGFGTLDDSSVNDAMDVLESVRKGTGTIGIISHVHLLENTIPTHLEVRKAEEGSSIVMR